MKKMCAHVNMKSGSVDRVEFQVIMNHPLQVNGLNNSSGPDSPPLPENLSRDDPWALHEPKDDGVKWSDYSTLEKTKKTSWAVIKCLGLVALLYLFVCSLDFLSSAFRLLGGKAAGEIFVNNDLLKNPLVGLMIGILATVLVQSSSTSTSIVVTMVASEIMDVPTAIPIIMGANVGTSVTNTLVSLSQCSDRNEFRRAFAAATVHDMFNWLSVVVFLSLEVTTGYLYHLTTAVVDSLNLQTQAGAEVELLTIITKPFTSLIIQLDKKVIEGVAMADPTYQNQSLIKKWCKTVTHTESVNTSFIHFNKTDDVAVGTVVENVTVVTGVEQCSALMNMINLNDTLIGVILLSVSLILLCTCLVLMVKILNSMLRGRVATVIRHTLNGQFPGRLAFLTGYAAILVGCGMTILVQSSSIFTSTLTPLVGVGVISLERMYPLTLGSNIGTTTTGILASMAATGPRLRSSVQIALCHLFFNLSGILLFYPIPATRLPIPMAKLLGDTTAQYRWFSVLYLVAAFFFLPGMVFALSAAGPKVLMGVGIPVFSLFVATILINVLQSKAPLVLPKYLRTWAWLPLWMHSLDPLDRVIVSLQQAMTFRGWRRGGTQSTTNRGMVNTIATTHGGGSEFVSVSRTLIIDGIDDSSLENDDVDDFYASDKMSALNGEKTKL